MAAIRGDGLFMAHSALAALVKDPQQLDRARRRFSESPPSYRTNLSGTTTRSQSPNPPSEEQQRREERQVQLRLEHRASLPYHQFEGQVSEECRCIYKEGSRNHSPPRGRWLPGPEIGKPAAENVKKRWIEQGIWKDEWNDNNEPDGRWKHEEPLEFESESETDSEAEPEPVFILGLRKPEAKPRRPKGDVEMRRIAERRPVREREREASRPYYQFFYQVLKTRERIQDESRVEGVPTEDSVDINTKAYENVKNTWIKRGIWNRKWGVLPGMSWKHEHPLEELIADDPVFAQTNGLEDHGRVAREAPPSAPPSPPPRWLFGSPRPIESSHSQASGAQPELPVAIDPAGLQNGNGNHSSPAPRSRRRLIQSRQESSAAAQRPLRGARETSRGGRPEARASLGPVNPSKVSKAPGKRAPVPPRPPHASGETSSAPMLPRRSKRLQEAKPSTAEDPSGIASTDSLKGMAQSRPKGIVAGGPKSAASTKPRGVSKRRRLSTTRHRARQSD
ncbi:hypothetical protein H9Q69_010361 [Fusarium xylarioides]|nr:hypothetical protein H9Q69_010361 [Fusarium xylarioides]